MSTTIPTNPADKPANEKAAPQSAIRRTPQARPSFAGFRRYGRRDVRCDVYVQDDEGWEIPLESVNVSPTGMFVESSLLFEAGESHTLIFRSPRDASWYRISARVVRVDEGEGDEPVQPPEDRRPGMAYEFLGTDERTWNHLCALVAGA